MSQPVQPQSSKPSSIGLMRMATSSGSWEVYVEGTVRPVTCTHAEPHLTLTKRLVVKSFETFLSALMTLYGPSVLSTVRGGTIRIVATFRSEAMPVVKVANASQQPDEPDRPQN